LRTKPAKRAAIGLFTVTLFFIFASCVFSAGQGTTGTETHGLDPTVLIGIAAMLVLAKVFGEIFERLHQPAVLGELFAGIALGNLVALAEPLKTDATVAALAELGVIILLFEVGLESDLKEMLEVGWSSLLVATVGVICPSSWVGLSLLTSFLKNHVSPISLSARHSARRVSALRRVSSKISAN